MPTAPALNAETLRRAAWYAAAFGATASLAEAQVIYVDPEDILVFDTYGPDDDGDGEPDFGWIPFDLDDDGDDEILFAHRNGPSTLYSLAFSDFPGEVPEGDYLSNIVGQLQKFDGLLYPYFAPLSAGYVLPGDLGSPNGLIESFIYQGTFTFDNVSPLNILEGEDTYIGLEFTLDGVDVHYAWMRIERRAEEEGEGFLIKDYAYNATPGGSVIVGSDQPVSADEEPHPQETAVAVLGPNPFGAAGTRVRVATDAPEQVRVEVLDALGRRVAVLHDGPVSGRRLFGFGADLAPGLYLLRVTGETFVQTTKLTRR